MTFPFFTILPDKNILTGGAHDIPLFSQFFLIIFFFTTNNKPTFFVDNIEPLYSACGCQGRRT